LPNPASPLDLIEPLMEGSGLPKSDEEEETDSSFMEDDDLPSQEDYSEATEDDQELLFDPFDSQEVEEEPELLFMGNDDDDELSSQEEADESDSESIEDNQEPPQPSFSYHDRKNMDEDFRRSRRLFDWLKGRLTPIEEEGQFELNELEGDQWISDHPDLDPWAPIEWLSTTRSSPIPSPNVDQGAEFEISKSFHFSFLFPFVMEMRERDK
jgi:hypothetical protein